ncbi:MAG: hypothetical protein ACFFDU_08205 [Candidatus Thorarchaeota archaeon]
MNEEFGDTIRNIRRTTEGKKPSKEILFITDSDMAQALDDPAKLEIILILGKGVEDSQTIEESNEATGETVIRRWPVQRYALSVSEIVKQSKQVGVVGLTRNQVYHHLPGLIDAGYVIKFGTVSTGKRTTDYFRRTAQTFVLPRDTPVVNEKFQAERMARDLKHIGQVFGFKIPEQERDEFMRLGVMMWQMKEEGAKLILRDLRADLVDSASLRLYDWLLELYMLGVEKYVQLGRQMQEILFRARKE